MHREDSVVLERRLRRPFQRVISPPVGLAPRGPSCRTEGDLNFPPPPGSSVFYTLVEMSALLSPRPLTSTPEDAALFVGREALVHRASTAAQLGGNALLIGAPGSGRSSALHQVERRLTAAAIPTAWADGAGIDDPVDLLLSILASFDVAIDPTVASSVPRLLAAVPRVVRSRRVILLDDLEPGAGRALFGRWRQHLWRLDASVVASATTDDPTPYLDDGAEAWWGDEVMSLDPLDATICRELLVRRIGAQHLPAEAERWIQLCDGSPRELIRRLRTHWIASAQPPGEPALADQPPSGLSTSVWAGEAAEELSASERRLLEATRRHGGFSLADREFLTQMGWSQSHAHRVAGRLVSLGVLTRSEERARGVGRPRVVYRVDPGAASRPSPRETVSSDDFSADVVR